MSSSLPALPIDSVLPALIDALRGNSCAVLRAPPGAGKTTRVPPAVLDAGFPGTVLMLEPRRLAARTAANRIAAERHCAVGEEVGYRVRFDQKMSPRTRIEIVTEGILVRRLQDDPFLEKIGAVIFDEFHERTLASDLALAMSRRVQQTVRPDLKLIVMSATLSPLPISQYLGCCPVLESEGRLHPVEIQYAEYSDQRPIAEKAAAGVVQVLERTTGDILVFLPGVGEIRRTSQLLEGLEATRNCAVMELYGDLPAERQDAVLRRSDRRKLVLSTNVAETSVTIEGITAVVDTGQARVMRFEPALGLDRLALSRISKAAAEQRSGRAGRTQPGFCLRLWTEREQRGMPDYDEPEIRRVDLAGSVLELLCWGEPDVEKFPWFEAPREAARLQALTLLERLGAVCGGKVTDLGRTLVRLPVHPRIGRLLFEGHRFGQSARAALAAALLSERDPFLRSEPSAGYRAATYRTESDLLERVSAIEEFVRSGRKDSEVGRLHPGGVHTLLKARDQLLRLLQQALGTPSGAEVVPPDEALLRAVFAAFPDRVVRRREPGSRRGMMVGGRGVRLWEKSAVLDAELFVCVELDAGQSEALVTQASAIRREWLPPESLQTEERVEFDEAAERVVALRRTVWEDLVLDEVGVTAAPGGDVAGVLVVAASRQLDRALPLDDPEVGGFLSRLRSLREWMPELELPSFGDAELIALLPQLCGNCRSFADLKKMPLLQFLKGALSSAQLHTLEREAPERIEVPSGSRIPLVYEPGRSPVLAVRIQELFGLAQTPRIAGGRVPVTLHLLGPNYRPQQITSDLRSFWDNTYPQVRKDLRRRYPKHAWPEDPWNAAPERKPQKRK